MKFFNNRIPTGTSNKKSFADLIKEATSKGSIVKTAEAATAVAKSPVKEANMANFGDKKANPFGKKEEDCAKNEPGCDDKDKNKDEAKANDAEAASEEVIVTAEAKEDYEEERRKDVHHMEGTKDQQSGKGNGEPQDNGAVTNKEGKKDEPKKEAKSKVAEKTAPAGEDNKKRTDVHHSEGTKDQQSGKGNGEPEDKQATASAVAPKAKAAATDSKNLSWEKLASVTWKKLANLTPKQKTFMVNYFSMYFPKAFVDALTADK